MHFEKVSYEEYSKMRHKDTPEVRAEYDAIKLPARATKGSAGYDFFMPYADFIGVDDIKSVIPTGIRAKIDPGYFLMLVPKSGLGTKTGMRLKNTVGIVDEDYYNADNEGHIMAAFKSDVPFRIEQGQKFMQAIFIPYGVADEEEVTATRTGGFGSTGK